MNLSDWRELFRNTIAAVSELKPEIAPFLRCYILDSAFRLVTVP